MATADTTEVPQVELEHLREYVRELHDSIDDTCKAYLSALEMGALNYHQKVRRLAEMIHDPMSALCEVDKCGEERVHPRRYCARHILALESSR